MRKTTQELQAFYRQDGFWTELSQEGKGSAEGSEPLDWHKRFEKDKYRALFHLGFLTREPWMTASVLYLHQISDLLVRRLSSRPDIELVRDQIELSLDEEEAERLLEEVPFANGSEFVDQVWLQSIWNRLLDVFREEIRGYDGSVAAYFTERNARITVAGRVFFHLVENPQDDFPFAFMATYSTKPEKSRKAIHTPLKNALTEFKKDQKKLMELMAAVARAGESSAFISELMESGELFSPLKFTAREAYVFLTEIPLYEKAGIMCRVPDWWRKRTNGIRLNLSVGEKKPSKVGLDAIMDFNPTLTIDGEKLTEKQLREFLKMAEGLIQYKGRWVEISKNKLNAALNALERAKELAGEGEISLGEAMRLELGMGDAPLLDADEVEVSVSNGKWLKELRSKLEHPSGLDKLEPEPSFHGELRMYQREGYQWLDMMARSGFGACLADDMGLGKTVQMIACLEHYRLTHGGHALLILPASLIGNWQKELEQFAPELPYQVLHKSGVKNGEEIRFDPSKFLCLTTYTMVTRLEEVADANWDIVILDEAQAIKNAGTKQSKAVRAISARVRIAMTGTPIENHLGDLWSLFDFLNKGLLGTPKEFAAFVKQIQQDDQGYARLRRMVNPFILRRLKTDRSIISDLPDKVEIKEYASLSKKQAALYGKLVEDIDLKLKTAEGMERKGLVLSSLMKFKQICNHPDQYLGQEIFKRENSGKFEQLARICETVYEKRERVLVFTQFREMTGPLSDFLEEIFHRKGLVLHGGTPVNKRSAMVERFNGEEYVPYMVLSLKAGGVGLNLTAANHVIHFDRWWNPAVENQATDRAFRIGQKKNVFVHKFITSGTIEEKIDAMIEEKQKLSGDILSAAGEGWITELDNSQIMDLFRLGGGKA